MSYEKAARIILKQCLNVKNAEKVLIIADKNTREIGEGIFNEAQNLSHAELVLIPVGKQNGDEPPDDIARRILEFDVVICPTTTSLTHTKAIKEAEKNGARVATLPGITSRIMRESVVADYNEIAKFTEHIFKNVDKRKHARVTTPSGTDIKFSLEKRNWFMDSGIIHKNGTGGNLPAGEVFIAPLEKTAQGVIVIDYFFDEKVEYAKKGTKFIVKNGEVVECVDKTCKMCTYFKTIKNARNVAEFGIGTNEKAKIIGNILQDEKVLGTCHIAFGNNSSMGGKVYSELHLDTVLQKPTIIIDGKMIMKDGEFLI